jgi:5,10-methylenetetrahydrofolate reductase
MAALLVQVGQEPVFQMVCRDRNRIALQSDLLSAHALGIENVLCLTGDYTSLGDHPEAKPVFDLDSVALLETIRIMRDEGRFLSGRRLTVPPQVFLGAAANPFAPPLDFRPLRLAKKIAAGAQFVQTQYCFDVPLLERYMARVRELGLHERCFILVGVGPLASPRAARWIRNNVPGVHIPDAVIERLERAEKPKQEGKRLCIELIQQIREIEGVAGVHVMAYRQEELVSEIISGSGILKGRRPQHPLKRGARPQDLRKVQ